MSEAPHRGFAIVVPSPASAAYTMTAERLHNVLAACGWYGKETQQHPGYIPVESYSRPYVVELRLFPNKSYTDDELWVPFLLVWRWPLWLGNNPSIHYVQGTLSNLTSTTFILL